MGRAIAGELGENAISAQLTSLLKEIGYENTEFERIYHVINGVRKPDVSFSSHRGICLVSAKLGSRNEVEAISTAQEYQQDFSDEDVAEVFSITYPRKGEHDYHLRVLANKEHPSISWSLRSLKDVANKIKEMYELRIEIARVCEESEITASIRVLRSGVINLTSTIMHSDAEEFENLFGGKHFFESVLGYDKISNKKQEILKNAAAYLFVNQILFYEILSSEMPDKYKRIEDKDLNNPACLMPQYFLKVLDVDYKPIFNFDVAGKFNSRESKAASKRIILAVRVIFPGIIQHELIGKVFHNIIPLEIRKTVAAYYTNSAAGDLLAKLSINSPEDLVMDPACGSGTLLVSAYKRKADLIGTEITKSIHKRFVEKELLGIDIMPFSAHLAAVNLALRKPLFETDNVNIAIDDSTTHKPGDVIPAVRESLKDAFKQKRLFDYDIKTKQTENVHRGSISLTEKNKEIELKKVDVVIMNPPFTSCDNLPQDYKEQLRSRFKTNSNYNRCLTGKLSFQAYFIFLADKFLKDNGRLACVIPQTTLVGKAFDKLTEFLLKNYTIEIIIFGLGRSAFSESTALSEILFIAKKSRPRIKHKFILVGTKNSPTEWSEDDVDIIAKQITVSQQNNQDSDSPLCVSKVFNQLELSQKSIGLSNMINKMNVKFEKLQSELSKTLYKSEKLSNFKNLEAKLKFDIFEGGAFAGTPINGYSALSYFEDERRMKKKTDLFLITEQNSRSIKIVNRFTKDNFTIPSKYVRPQVRRLSAQKSIDISKYHDCVAKDTFPILYEIMNQLYEKKTSDEYIKQFMNEGKKKINEQISNLVLARRIDISATGTNLLAVYSEEPAFVAANAWGIKKIDNITSKILCLWINSSIFLLELLTRRASTRGSFGQIDKRYLHQISCIDPSKLTMSEVKKLEKTFEEISILQFPSISDQLQTRFEGRVMIDTAFLKLFGMDDNIIDRLYPVLLERFNTMKNTMSKD